MRPFLFLSLFLLIFPALALGFAGLPDIPETPPELTIPVPEEPEEFPDGPEGGGAGGAGGGGGGFYVPPTNATEEPVEETTDGAEEDPLAVEEPETADEDEPAQQEGQDEAADDAGVSPTPQASADSLFGLGLPPGVTLAVGGAVGVLVLLLVIVAIVRSHRRRDLPQRLKKF